MHTHVNPTFPYLKCGFPGCSLHGRANVTLKICLVAIINLATKPVRSNRHQVNHKCAVYLLLRISIMGFLDIPN